MPGQTQDSPESSEDVSISFHGPVTIYAKGQTIKLDTVDDVALLAFPPTYNTSIKENQ